MGDATWSLKAALRRLWADHVNWSRQYVVAAVGDAPDTEAAAGRLLKNQEDIGRVDVPSPRPPHDSRAERRVGMVAGATHALERRPGFRSVHRRHPGGLR